MTGTELAAYLQSPDFETRRRAAGDRLRGGEILTVDEIAALLGVPAWLLEQFADAQLCPTGTATAEPRKVH